MSSGKNIRLGLLSLAAAAMVAALYLALVYAPEEASMGQVQRIFYFHVASGWTALLAFTVVFAASIAYLRGRDPRWDALALSAAEIGVLFTTLILLTGSLWAKPAWGTWWTWDPRLTTTLVLWLIYVSYLLLRGAVEGPTQRATFAAVVGIVGFVDAPIVFMSIRWWRTIHPVVVETSGFQMAGPMVVALLGALVAFSLLFAWLLALRFSLEQARMDVGYLRHRLGLLASARQPVGIRPAAEPGGPAFSE